MVSFIWTSVISACSSAFRLTASTAIYYYLFLKNRKRQSVPAGRFKKLPVVTVQLPIFNEIYVVERLLRSVSNWIIRAIVCKSRCWTIRLTTRARLRRIARRNCASAALMSN